MWLQDDHFIAEDADTCGNITGTVSLRTLGFVLDDSGAAAAKTAGLITVALFRCFDNATKNHAVSLSEGCDGKGKMEFSFGHIVAASAPPPALVTTKTDDDGDHSVTLGDQ